MNAGISTVLYVVAYCVYERYYPPAQGNSAKRAQRQSALHAHFAQRAQTPQSPVETHMSRVISPHTVTAWHALPPVRCSLGLWRRAPRTLRPVATLVLWECSADAPPKRPRVHVPPHQTRRELSRQPKREQAIAGRCIPTPIAEGPGHDQGTNSPPCA